MYNTYVQKTDIPALMELYRENLGSGYADETQILHCIEDSREYFFASRREDGELCGILLFGEEPAEVLAEQTRIPLETLLKMAKGKKLLKCRCMCVAKDCQKNGVGKELFARAMQEIRSGGQYGLITSLLWEYNGVVPAEKLHIEYGFRFWHRLKMPWYGHEGYCCIICGGRCRCDGLQYILEL